MHTYAEGEEWKAGYETMDWLTVTTEDQEIRLWEAVLIEGIFPDGIAGLQLHLSEEGGAVCFYGRSNCESYTSYTTEETEEEAEREAIEMLAD